MIFMWYRGSMGMGFVGTVMLMAGLAVVPLGIICALGSVTLRQMTTEQSYKQQYGDAWQAHFETDKGSLTQARTKAIVSVPGIIVIAALYVFLIKQFSGAMHGRTRSTRRRKRRRSSSHSARA